MLFSLTNPEVAIMMMGIFLFAVLLGFPIAFTLMAMGLGFGYYAYFDPTKMEHLFDNRIVICIQTGSWPERGTERDAEETEKILMRTSQQGNKEDVI